MIATNIIKSSLSNFLNSKSLVFSKARDVLLNGTLTADKTYSLLKLNLIKELDDGRVKLNIEKIKKFQDQKTIQEVEQTFSNLANL